MAYITSHRLVLAPRFFRQLSSKRGDDGAEYRLYQSTSAGATMMLQSGNTPLAALTFIGTKGRQALTKRRDNEFYGVTDCECDMEFVLTNLVVARDGETKENALNIQILDESGLQRVNKVNCIYPSQSVHVQGDARNSEYSMKIEAIRDTVTGGHVTVADAESSTEPRKQQSKFVLSVSAIASNKKLVDLVAAATWVARDTFVVSLPATPVSNMVNPFGSDSDSDDDEVFRDDWSGVSKSVTRSIRPSSSRTRNEMCPIPTMYGRGPPTDTQQRTVPATPVSNMVNPFADEEAPEESCDGPSDDDDGFWSELSKSDTQPILPASLSSMKETCPMPTMCGQEPPTNARKRTEPPTGFSIDSAKAAKIVKGDTQHIIKTNDVNAEFDYDKCAPQCTLAICIWEELLCLAYTLSADEVNAVLSHAMAQTVDAVMADVKNIFDSETCVVCMDETPTIVIAQCGHLCACGACFGVMCKNKTNVTCPLCRSPVVAGIPSTKFQL